MEIYKDVKGYEGHYRVSNLGRVISLKYNKERLLKQGSDKLGYKIIMLSVMSKQRTRTVHQLVAEAFLGFEQSGHKLVVNHINLNKKDNRLENLEIVTQRENANLKHIPSSSIYVGAYYWETRNKWVSYIHIKSKKIHLGVFKTEIEAGGMYQMALKYLHLYKGDAKQFRETLRK